MIISLDTETTGLDFFHGAKPFLVTTCDGDGVTRFWEWAVDPFTRQPIVLQEDVEEIVQLLDAAEIIAMQNPKFDAHALAAIGIELPWRKVRDTLRAGHLLASNLPHNLTDMCVQYLGYDIQPLETRVKEATTLARKIIRDGANCEFHGWRIAKEDAEDMPSVNGSSKRDEDKPWKNDMWLPRALLSYWDSIGQSWDDDTSTQHWLTVTAEYANGDSSVTLPLWQKLEHLIRQRGYWEIYSHTLRLPEIAYAMERRGVSLSGHSLEQLLVEYGVEVAEAADKLLEIANELGHELELPNGASPNDSLREMFYGSVRLTCDRCGFVKKVKHWAGEEVPANPKCSKCAKKRRPVTSSCTVAYNSCLDLELLYNAKSKSSSPTLDKDAIDHYEATLPEGSGLTFVKTLKGMRSRATACTYMESYKRFWIKDPEAADWYKLHPVFNPTGTDTLRWSSYNPNATNISKKENFNLRRAFGPAPGREWWSMDGKNLELRIPAYESEETDLIWIFEHPKDAPYYGSYHLVVFDVLHPQLFKEHGAAVKELFESTYYQWVKNGNFACVPMDTLALTRTGWKTYDQVEVGDLVAGYKDKKLEWTPVLEKVLLEDRELVKISNQHFEAVSTPDHRWLSRRRVDLKHMIGHKVAFTTTEKIHSEDSLIVSAELNDEATLPITPVEAAIIGLVYTDGSIEQSKYVGASSQAGGRKVKFRALIHQSKSQGIAYIDELLRQWGGLFKRRVTADGMTHWDLNPTATRDIWSRAGFAFETEKFEQDFELFVLGLGTEARRSFLKAVYLAEGHLDPNGSQLCSQNKGAFADAIRLAMFLSGAFVTEHVKKTNYPTDKTCLEFRAAKPEITGQKLIKENLGKAQVWCVRTALGTWVMRQGDKIMLTGNCIYGAQRAKADATYHQVGAFDKVSKRFPKIAQLSERQKYLAERRGYVETIPDKTICAARGYPLLASRTEDGRVSPTTPLNYHISGTAMQWTNKAMVRTDDQLRQWQADGWDGFLTIQVHDELVFDTPRGVGDQPWLTNLPKMRQLQKLMELGGNDIAVPTPVSVEWHCDSWATGKTL